MKLFSRKKKEVEQDKDRILGPNTTLKKSRYDNLQDLLLGEVGVGSLDLKLVSIVFPEDRIIKLWVAKDYVLAADDSLDRIKLGEFLFWFGFSKEIKNNLINEVKVLTPETLIKVEEVAPRTIVPLVNHLLDYTEEKVKWTADNFENYLSVSTEFFEKDSVPLKRLSFVIPIKQLNDYVEEMKKNESSIASLMQITGVPYKNVTLSEGPHKDKPKKPEEKFIYEAAAAESTLADAIAIGTGFSVNTLLSTTVRLAELDAIDLEIIEENIEELPELLSIKERPYERVFTVTAMEGPLDELVANVFADSEWNAFTKDLVKRNAELEERIVDIEENVIRELRHEDFRIYNALSPETQTATAVLLAEREEHNVTRVGILEKIAETIAFKDGVEEQKLLDAIDSKLSAIDRAVLKFELSLGEENTSNRFEIDKEELVFNSKDQTLVDGKLVDVEDEVESSDGDFFSALENLKLENETEESVESAFHVPEDDDDEMPIFGFTPAEEPETEENLPDLDAVIVEPETATVEEFPSLNFEEIVNSEDTSSIKDEEPIKPEVLAEVKEENTSGIRRVKADASVVPAIFMKLCKDYGLEPNLFAK